MAALYINISGHDKLKRNLKANMILKGISGGKKT